MSKDWRKLVSRPQYGITEERDIYVSMRDRTRLAVNVFRPDADSKFPALLSLSGYGKDEMEMRMPPQPLFKSAVWDGNLEAGDTSEYVPRGYVHIIGDVRGTGYSEGEYFGGFTKQEAEDGAELVEWVAQQPWCDGNVGMLGYSYFGGIQLKVAGEQPPHLKAICPTHINSDYYRDFAYNGGVLSLFGYGVWQGRHGTSGYAPNNAVSEMIRTLPEEELERRRRELLDHPDIKHYPNLYHLLCYPQKNPMTFDILLNPYDGPFWQERSIYPLYDRIKVPVFAVGKMGHGSSYWDIYNNVNTPYKKIIVKPSGAEERPWREDIDEIIRWYDHWLKGNDTGMMDEPPIKFWVTGINQWRYEHEWPLQNIEYTKCYLRRWEGLSFEPELYQPEPDCFLQQPLHLSNKRDSVKYISPPLSSDLELIGRIALNLYASIDQDDTNWIVNLIDVAPGDMERGVGRGYLKASHRAVDPDKCMPGSPYRPHTSSEPVIPGEIYEYAIGMGVISHVFRPGHRIKLTIQSLESPRDPEMQIHYHHHLCGSKTVLHKVYRNREYRSHLELPVIPGKLGLPETLCDDNFL